MRDASGTPATPMMPHMLVSVSHTPWNGAEIYVAQPADRLVDRPVSQGDPEGALGAAHAARSEERHAQLAGDPLNRSRALRLGRDDGATVGFAERQLLRRESCVV